VIFHPYRARSASLRRGFRSIVIFPASVLLGRANSHNKVEMSGARCSFALTLRTKNLNLLLFNHDDAAAASIKWIFVAPFLNWTNAAITLAMQSEGGWTHVAV
jgi:hypothetical protein